MANLLIKPIMLKSAVHQHVLYFWHVHSCYVYVSSLSLTEMLLFNWYEKQPIKIGITPGQSGDVILIVLPTIGMQKDSVLAVVFPDGSTMPTNPGGRFAFPTTQEAN